MKLGAGNLLTKLVAPASIIQAVIPDMFKNTPASFFSETMEVFEKNALLCYSKLKGVLGLKPVMPEGALYMMVCGQQLKLSVGSKYRVQSAGFKV